MAQKIRYMVGHMTSNTRHSFIPPEHVFRVMGNGLDKSKKIMNVTTQKIVRTAVNPIRG